MTTNEFIFSNRRKYRLSRHVVFWILFSLHFVIQNLMVGGPGEGRTSRTFLQSSFHFLYFFPIYVLSTYFFVSVLLPKFLYKSRYAAFSIFFLVLYAVCFVAVYYAGLLYIHHQSNTPIEAITSNQNKYHAIVDGLFLPFMLFGITAGIKFSKKWYLQQRENERLAKQKLATELQILKTSLHPRFLFHSLRTVEKYIHNSSLQSPSLILQLSDLLSYILYENDKKWVMLEKELEIVRSYISLEEKDFEKKPLFKTKFPAHVQDTFIMPCILLSIVEIAFEHFHESRQEEPKLDLSITLPDDGMLDYKLLFRTNQWGLVEKELEKIRRQLENHYAGTFQLRIHTGGVNMGIALKLPLYSPELIGTNKNTILNEAPVLV